MFGHVLYIICLVMVTGAFVRPQGATPLDSLY